MTKDNWIKALLGKIICFLRGNHDFGNDKWLYWYNNSHKLDHCLTCNKKRDYYDIG